ncbi:MAG: hypothetical protein CMJ18_05955 [Phycisphaeraceae bacterium]|nr:hypothetical protein [Phycisphaeraceae bacterium]
MPGNPETGAASNDNPWHGRKVIVAVTGGIACYKVPTIVSRLAQGGAEVRVLMTPAATRFVTPLTFQSLSGHAVLTDPWRDDVEHPESPHIGLARWCDLFIVAPATADIMARLAAGLCQDIVSLTASALPRTTPVLLAPAMNEQMWENPITQRNVETVRSVLGYNLVGPAEGWQACRMRGAGRMSEPDEILSAASGI